MGAIVTNPDNIGYFNPPNVYRPAIIDIRIVGEYSAEDGATNTYRIVQNDGKIFEFDVKNGSGGSAGRSVTSVEQIQVSTESLGKNIARITLSDGTYTDVEIRNGAQGQVGPQGERGPAGIDSVEASIGTNDPTQAPSVDKDLTEGVLSLTFNNIKGGKGDKGDQGNSGYTGAAEELEVVNNLTDGGATSALSAEMGKTLGKAVVTYGEDITSVETGNAYLTGTVGNQITKRSSDSYRYIKIDCSEISQFYIRIYRRNETWYWVYFVDASEIILSKTLSSSASSYGITEEILSVPNGAVYAYIHTYYRTGEGFILDVKSVTLGSLQNIISRVDTLENTKLDVHNINIARGKVTFAGATVTIPVGDYYFQDESGGVYNKHVSKELTFTCSGDNLIVFNKTSYQFYLRTNVRNLVSGDVVLLIYDDTKGFKNYGTLWGQMVLENNMTTAINEVTTLAKGRKNWCVVRGNVTISGTTVTIPVGDYYFFDENGNSYNKHVGTEVSFTCTGDDLIVFNKRNANFSKRTLSELDVDDVILLMYDGVRGFVNYGTLWGQIAFKKQIDATINEAVSGISVEQAPDFVWTEGLATFKRLHAWDADAKISILGHVTDIHSGGNSKYKHVGYLEALNDVFGFSLLCNAGDIGLDVGETEDAAYKLLQNTKKGMKTDTPWVFCKGNHDYGTAHISNKTVNNILNGAYKRRFQDRIHSVWDGESLGYGYYDDTECKVRYIYLNTSEGNTGAYTMKQAQLTWLVERLTDTPTGYGIVILTHLCIDEIGRWNSYPDDAAANCFVAMRTMLADFVGRASGSSAAVGISWDFTNVSASTKLVCSLAGDSHFDNYIKRNGVNYIVRQGYGGISASDIPDGGVKTSFDYSTQCLFDVLAVDVSNSKAKIFRIGAGGEDRDIEFNF